MGISEQGDHIVAGFWRNYDLPAWRNAQILVTDNSAQVITNTVAVLLALTLPRLVVFLKLLVPAFQSFSSKCRTLFGKVEMYANRSQNALRQIRSEFSDDISIVEYPEPIQLHDLGRSGARIASGVGDSIADAHSFGDAATRIVANNLTMGHMRLPAPDRPTRQNKLTNMLINLREDTWTFTWLLAVVILLLLLTIGQQVIAISTAFIVTDSAALLTSPFCGVWFSEYYSDPKIRFSYPSEDENPPPPILITNLPNERDLKSISYAETCYNKNARDGECSYFFKPSISFEEIHNSSCPFAEGTCLYGSSGAYTIDTGYVDSGALGFNEPVRCEFRMHSTCSPIRPDEPYVRSKSGREPGSREVSYYFGHFGKNTSKASNFTMATTFPMRTKEFFRHLLFTNREHHIKYD